MPYGGKSAMSRVMRRFDDVSVSMRPSLRRSSIEEEEFVGVQYNLTEVGKRRQIGIAVGSVSRFAIGILLFLEIRLRLDQFIRCWLARERKQKDSTDPRIDIRTD